MFLDGTEEFKEMFDKKSQIIAHRGYWCCEKEQNSERAFRKALSGGYGIETDVRDLNGEIVISHAPPKQSDPYPIPLHDFIAMCNEYYHSLPIAPTISSD